VNEKASVWGAVIFWNAHNPITQGSPCNVADDNAPSGRFVNQVLHNAQQQLVDPD